MSDQPVFRQNERTLRAERQQLLARYDSGAMPPGVARTLKEIETLIAEIQQRRTQNGSGAISRA